MPAAAAAAVVAAVVFPFAVSFAVVVGVDPAVVGAVSPMTRKI